MKKENKTMKKLDIFEINDENRIHINMSKHSMSIIESDMIKFNDDYELSNRSGFINVIIKNYFDDFPLSRNQALKQLIAIQKATDRANIRADDKEHFHTKLSSVIIDEFSNEIMRTLIVEYSNKFTNDHQFKIKLNKENASLLSSIEDAKYFNKHAPRNAGISFYIKIMLESYAILNRQQRERIFFRETIEKFESALNTKCMIKYKDGDIYKKAIPIAINNPKVKQNMEAIISTLDETGKGGIIETHTIKALAQQDLRVTKEKNTLAGFDDFLVDLFEKKESVSVYPEVLFKVKFTWGGLKRFMYEEDRLPIIGIQDPENDRIYTFKTTESQLFFHIFKFGSQAQILEPRQTRERFKQLYKASYDAYETRDLNTGSVE